MRLQSRFHVTTPGFRCALLLGGLLLTVAVVLGPRAAPVGASAAGQSGWLVEPTANRSGNNPNLLNGVSCTSSSTCTAVGTVSVLSLYPPSLVERWNGATWQLESTPVVRSGSLAAVSCTSRQACVAVGYYSPRGSCCEASLVERWNGSTWRVQRSPNPAAQDTFLSSVSCTSRRFCIAVGMSYKNGGVSPERTVVERWNGRSWQVDPSPNPRGRRDALLSGVSCISAHACTTVGSSHTDRGPGTVPGPSSPLVEQSNGGGWKITRTPQTPAGALTGISCTSRHECIAVGSIEDSLSPRAVSSGTLAELWDGTRWTIQKTPTGSQFNAVSCTSADACTAVGSASGMTFAARWNGIAWKVQITPTLANAYHDQLRTVSCTSAQACTAVGIHSSRRGGPRGVLFRTLAEQWRGGNEQRPEPHPQLVTPRTRTSAAKGVGQTRRRISADPSMGLRRDACPRPMPVPSGSASPARFAVGRARPISTSQLRRTRSGNRNSVTYAWPGTGRTRRERGPERTTLRSDPSEGRQTGRVPGVPQEASVAISAVLDRPEHIGIHGAMPREDADRPPTRALRRGATMH